MTEQKSQNCDDMEFRFIEIEGIKLMTAFVGEVKVCRNNNGQIVALRIGNRAWNVNPTTKRLVKGEETEMRKMYETNCLGN